MADPVDVARQWLTEVLDRAPCRHPGAAPAVFCAPCTADAILQTPGVEVDDEQGAIFGGMFGRTIRGAATHTRTVIHLPAQAIEETRPWGG